MTTYELKNNEPEGIFEKVYAIMHEAKPEKFPSLY